MRKRIDASPVANMPFIFIASSEPVAINKCPPPVYWGVNRKGQLSLLLVLTLRHVCLWPLCICVYVPMTLHKGAVRGSVWFTVWVIWWLSMFGSSHSVCGSAMNWNKQQYLQWTQARRRLKPERCTWLHAVMAQQLKLSLYHEQLLNWIHITFAHKNYNHLPVLKSTALVPPDYVGSL